MNLQLHDLTIRLMNNNMRRIVEHLSLTLNPNDRLAIIGEEGCGKTTVLDYLNQPSSIDGYTLTTWSGYTPGAISYLPQKLDNDRLRSSVSTFFFTHDDGSLDYDHLENYERFKRFASNYGFDRQWFDQDPLMDQLSGGQRMRYRLAICLFDKTDVILMDEPTNDLDIPSIENLIHTITKLDQIIIFVSHDTYFLSKVATHILEMRKIEWLDHNEVIFHKSSYDDYVKMRMDATNKAMMVYQSESRKRKEKAKKLEQIRSKVEYAQNQAVRTPSVARKLAKKIKAVNQQIEHNAQMTMVKPTDVSAIPLSFKNRSISSKHLLWSNHYPSLNHGTTHLLDAFTLTLHHDDHWVLVGENGCGKTTLMDLLYSQLSLHYPIAYLHQSIHTQLDLNHSPFDDLSHALGYDKTTSDLIHTTLSALHLSYDEIHQPYANLSQGTLTKCILAKMVLGDYQILLLDEPTRNISPLSVSSLSSLLKSFSGCILCVSHDRYFIESTFQNVLWFNHHQLIQTNVSTYLNSIMKMVE